MRRRHARRVHAHLPPVVTLHSERIAEICTLRAHRHSACPINSRSEWRLVISTDAAGQSRPGRPPPLRERLTLGTGSSSGLEPVVDNATIIAGFAGLLGLLAGRFWDSRSEARRWRRDQRIRTYEQFAGAYYASREAFRIVALLDPGSADAEAAASQAFDRGVTFNRAMVAVWLHGSAQVAIAAHQVDVALNELMMTARARRFTWEEWRERRAPAEHAIERFTEAVRAELSLPKVPVTIRIDRLRGLGDPDA